MKAACINKLPVQPSVRRDIYAGGAATDELVLIEILHAAAIAMGRLYRHDPAFTAVMCDDAIFFAGAVTGEISPTMTN